ncbi:MAG: hypothetical protein K2H18_02635 [Muribaculaceae bacterium]|nr:hypothetical protein [Muribaculaceae bacterium]
MKKKPFNGKALYQPSGKAAEYSPWACNFYTGCSNDCEYCYCKRGVMSYVWSTEPRLKKCFKDEHHALDVFKNELIKARLDYASIKERGILFSFTTDPMIPGKTFGMTLEAMMITVIGHHIPVQILTKRADWLKRVAWKRTIDIWKMHAHLIAFGFTLTGFDELEPGASLTDERIEAMRELHNMGFKTFASIEPVIIPAMSRNMIEATKDFCDLYKIGLISGKGKDYYNKDHLTLFYKWLLTRDPGYFKVYLKDSFLKYFNIPRENLCGNFVNSDYNIFKPLT